MRLGVREEWMELTTATKRPRFPFLLLLQGEYCKTRPHEQVTSCGGGVTTVWLGGFGWDMIGVVGARMRHGGNEGRVEVAVN